MWRSCAALVAGGLALASPAAASTPVVVVPDAARAARVPVVGGSAAETRAARSALAAVAATLGVQRVEFGRQGTGRSVVLTLPRPTRTGGLAGTRRYFLGMLAVREIARRQLRLPGRHVRWVELRPDGEGLEYRADLWPGRGTPALTALAEAVGDRAAASGFAVRTLRAWVLGPGAVEVAIRLDERQFLAGPTNWLTRILDNRSRPDGYSALLVVEGPDGTPVFEAGNTGRWSGFAGYGAPVAGSGRAGPPVGLHGPTRLVLRLQNRPLSGPEQLRRVVLDCSGGRSTGVVRPGAVCKRLIADRYALLAPVASDTTCSGGVGGGSVDLTGTVFGVRVQRSYSTCYEGTVARWNALLGAS